MKCRVCKKTIRKPQAEYKYEGESDDMFSCYECFEKRPFKPFINKRGRLIPESIKQG